LRARDATKTLALLDRAHARFGEGALAQERWVLRIEALWALGRRAEASRSADEFLRVHASSPHASRVRTFRE
jgi:hypothetical protein